MRNARLEPVPAKRTRRRVPAFTGRASVLEA